jgi:exonuclease SbcC
MENIRSYKSLDIDFDKGTSLFEGDIGSGKSSILMAVEFALFGLGNLKGNSLLRTSEKEGLVKLRFTIDETEYEVQRKLERAKKTVNQVKDGCYIKTPEGLLPLSPSELKPKILEILNFNEPPSPKAKSVIFTYGVYTPQEEMKKIISESVDDRLQTLRKAFGIEDYKVATGNAGELSTRIDAEARELRGASSGIDDDMRRKVEVEQSISEETEKISPLEAEMHKEGLERAEISKQLKVKREENLRLAKLLGQLPEVEKRVKDAERRLQELDIAIKRDQNEADKLKPKIDFLQLTKRPTERSKEEITAEIDGLKKDQKKLTREEGALESKIDDYGKIKEEGICPTCDRPADPKEFEGKVTSKVAEKEGISKRLASIEENVASLQALVETLQKYEADQTTLAAWEERYQQLTGSVTENNITLAGLVEQKNKDDVLVESSKGNKLLQEEIEGKILSLLGQDQEKELAISGINSSLATIRKGIEDARTEQKQLEKAIKKKQEIATKSEKLNEYVIWIRDYFIPALQMIETNVMATINGEFNEKFRNWFGILVEDNTKDARIDEDFTPMVEQDGYEQDLDFLSGGEKTSVALAYRLALNSLVQKVCLGLKSNLLVLDEPTDGFSKEQLFKVRDILSELKCPQVILVSHEKELESFADHVYKVAKTNGVSEIVAQLR